MCFNFIIKWYKYLLCYTHTNDTDYHFFSDTDNDNNNIQELNNPTQNTDEFVDIDALWKVFNENKV